MILSLAARPLVASQSLGMVFGMELGEERRRSENGEARTARRTNSLCTPAVMAGDDVDGRPEWDRKSADIMGDALDGPS